MVLTICFSSYKPLLKDKKKPGTSQADLFSAWILKKNISRIIFAIYCLNVITLNS